MRWRAVLPAERSIQRRGERVSAYRGRERSGAQEPDTYEGPPPAGGYLCIVLETVSSPSQCFVERNTTR